MNRASLKSEIRESVCVVGLGTVGFPAALQIHSRGFLTFGYDIDKKKAEEISEFPVFFKWSSVPKTQIYVICVDTGWKNGRPDMTNLFDVCHNIARREDDPLVCIESTVSLGTSSKLAELFDKVYLVHVPHRYWQEEPLKHGVTQKRVIGALNDASLRKAKKFYEKLDIPLYPVPSLEIAEMTKIAENAYRFVQIAFAEEVGMICEKKGISFQCVRDGANTKWNVTLMEAREGIAGRCLPKDTRYLRSLWRRSPLLSGAIKADELYKSYVKAHSRTHDAGN